MLMIAVVVVDAEVYDVTLMVMMLLGDTFGDDDYSDGDCDDDDSDDVM